VFIPPLPHNLKEMEEHNVAAMSAMNGDTLQRVWDELDYRVDVCHVTRGAYIENL
jgi:hypothetical protein